MGHVWYRAERMDSDICNKLFIVILIGDLHEERVHIGAVKEVNNMNVGKFLTRASSRTAWFTNNAFARISNVDEFGL